MRLWNWRKKKPSPETVLNQYRVAYPTGQVFGVTAASPEIAEDMVAEEIFHHQTIPGFPETVQMNLDQAQEEFPEIAREKITERGIWYPAI